MGEESRHLAQEELWGQNAAFRGVFFFLRSFAICCVESALLSVSMADGKIHLT